MKWLASVLLTTTTVIASDTPERDFAPAFDIHFTPYAGAENLITIHKSLERLEDRYLPRPRIASDDLAHMDSAPALSMKTVYDQPRERCFVFGRPSAASSS